MSESAREAAEKAMQLTEERKKRGQSTAGTRSLPPGALEILRAVRRMFFFVLYFVVAVCDSLFDLC
jgi:hypothetical protein